MILYFVFYIGSNILSCMFGIGIDDLTTSLVEKTPVLESNNCNFSMFHFSHLINLCLGMLGNLIQVSAYNSEGNDHTLACHSTKIL